MCPRGEPPLRLLSPSGGPGVFASYLADARPWAKAIRDEVSQPANASLGTQ